MKKKLLPITILLTVIASAQVGINTSNPNESSVLDVVSVNKGVLFPRMTQEQRESIVNPAEGLIIYNKDRKRLQINIGTASSPEWRSLSLEEAEAIKKNLNVDLKCETMALQGALKKGRALSTENNLSINVDVKELSTEPTENTYSIETNSPNGYKFSTSGEFTQTGEQTITLQGSGTPINAQTDNLNLTFKSKSCDKEVVVSAPKVVTIGSALFGSSTSLGNPVYFEDGLTGWAETIYNKSQIGTSGTITSISYLIDGGYGACTTNIPKQKVYMKLVDKDSFSKSSQDDVETMEKVFEGTITWVKGENTESGWTRIELDKPFEYDNSKNLLISFVNDYGKGDSCLGNIFGGPSFVVDSKGDAKVSKYVTRYPRKSNQYPVIKLEFK